MEGRGGEGGEEGGGKEDREEKEKARWGRGEKPEGVRGEEEGEMEGCGYGAGCVKAVMSLFDHSKHWANIDLRFDRDHKYNEQHHALYT